MIKTKIIAASILMASFFGLLSPIRVAAQVDVFPQCDSGSNSELCKGSDDDLFGSDGVWNRILNTITFVTGAAAVAMIIFGGFKYAISEGNKDKITAAKKTIIYSVVGLILSIMANAIINFVIASV